MNVKKARGADDGDGSRYVQTCSGRYHIITLFRRPNTDSLGRPLPMVQPVHKNICKKKSEVLQYCDSNELIELTVGTSRVLMSKAATNTICSNKHKA
jgi:hypothetical protein